MVGYWLKRGIMFLLMKDKITDVLYICPAIKPFLPVDHKKGRS